MGTNYYHRTNICACCDRYDEQHICKSLTNFEAPIRWLDEAPYGPVVVLSSWAEWKQRLREVPGQVWNEYGEQLDVEEFIQRVEATSAEGRGRQYEWMREHQPERTGRVAPDCQWVDADGFSFYGGGFS